MPPSPPPTPPSPPSPPLAPSPPAPPCALTKVCSASSEGVAGVLSCPAGMKILQIDYAYFGQPLGTCGPSSDATDNPACPTGAASGAIISALVAGACVGETSCNVVGSVDGFGVPDPCPGLLKTLAIRATCGYDSCAVPPPPPVAGVPTTPTPPPNPSLPPPAPSFPPLPIGSFDLLTFDFTVDYSYFLFDTFIIYGVPFALWTDQNSQQFMCAVNSLHPRRPSAGAGHPPGISSQKAWRRQHN